MKRPAFSPLFSCLHFRSQYHRLPTPAPNHVAHTSSLDILYFSNVLTSQLVPSPLPTTTIIQPPSPHTHTHTHTHTQACTGSLPVTPPPSSTVSASLLGCCRRRCSIASFGFFWGVGRRGFCRACLLGRFLDGYWYFGVINWFSA